MTTLKCKASSGRIVVFVGSAGAEAEALASARGFGIELGERGEFGVKFVAEDELPAVADALHSAFVFPLHVDGPLQLGADFGTPVGSWPAEPGAYWGGLYEVFPDCEESIGAQYVLVLAKQDELPAQRWASLPHLTDADRIPAGATFPEALELPGDAMDQEPLPDLRALFGGAGGPSKRSRDDDARAEKKSSDAVASRLFAAIAQLGDDDDDDEFGGLDDDLDDASDEPAPPKQERDPFVKFIKDLVAEDQLALVEGASARKLAERLELALERDPMTFNRPGDWFFEQDEVDELFASDEELITAIRNALSRD
ncbi:MAG: hypothetical protein AAGA54_06990 [Myxococcota bacterium]